MDLSYTLPKPDLRSIAALKRTLHPGDRFWSDNRLHPEVSGWRTVRKVQTRDLSYWIKNVKDRGDAPPPDGTSPEDHVGWTRWPGRGEYRMTEDGIEFILCVGPHAGEVAFAYLFGAAAQKAAKEASRGRE